MARTIDADQLKKIDRKYNRPIYLVHLYMLWTYKGRDENSNAAQPYYPGRIIYGQSYQDRWLSDGIMVGDSFKIDARGTWGIVESIESDHQVTLVENYPAWEGGVYTFKREFTLYFSDRNLNYNGIDYEDYLYDLSEIGSQVSELGGYDNNSVMLRFKNQRIRAKDYLIELFGETLIEDMVIEIYKLLMDPDEKIVSDVATKIFKGYMSEPFDIEETEFKGNAYSMLFGKNDKLPLKVINETDFPNASKNDMGKTRNIIYGSLKKVVCPWTTAGWVSTITDDITYSATQITISDVEDIPNTPFTTTIDNEQVRVISRSEYVLTVTRAYGGTSPVSHNRGAICYQKLGSYIVEVAQHGVKSIGDVYGKRGSGEWVRLASGFTKYIGNSTNRAYISFTDMPKWEEKTNLESELSDEPHSHTATPPEGNLKKECLPSGSSGPSGHGLAKDGNTESYCGLSAGQTLSITFTESELGTIVRQYLYIYKLDTGTTGLVYPGGITLGAATGWHRISGTGGEWNTGVSITGGTYGNQISEVYKVVEYTPYAPVIDDRLLEPYLSGNPTANMVVADTVACDVDGYPDDGSGTYTGTASALIQRPDHVRKHILIALLGFTTGEIGSSFASVGTIYTNRISGGYKFAFILHEIAREAMDLFANMDVQSRSVTFESGGKFELYFNDFEGNPDPEVTFNGDNIKGFFVFNKTEAVEIKNKLIGHYFRDYSKSGSLGDIYQRSLQLKDWYSINLYGEKLEEIELGCIGDLEAMADDVLDAIIHKKKGTKKTVKFNALWDAFILQPCDWFLVQSNFWSDIKFKTIRWVEKISEQIIEIEGIQYDPQ